MDNPVIWILVDKNGLILPLLQVRRICFDAIKTKGTSSIVAIVI